MENEDNEDSAVKAGNRAKRRSKEYRIGYSALNNAFQDQSTAG